MTLHARKHRGELAHISVYVDVFSRSVWISVAVSLAVVFLGLLVVAAFNGLLVSPTQIPALLENFALGDGNSITVSHKVLFLTACLEVYLLYAHFCCVLTATMTSGPIYAPVKSFEDAFRLGYQVTCIKDRAEEGVLANAKSASWQRRVYEETMNGNRKAFFADEAPAIDGILSNPMQLHFSAVLYVQHPDVKALTLKDDVVLSLAFGFQKNSGRQQCFYYDFSGHRP